MNKMCRLTILCGIMALSSYSYADRGGQDTGHNLRALSDKDFLDDGEPASELVELGRFLMYDKLLSGNMNISCATCHHPLAGTGDGLSLPVGEGGNGLGVARDTGSGLQAIEERVPRNAPQVWNVGAREFSAMFHDGRAVLDPDYPSGCKTPAGENLPDTLSDLIACQAMFPVTSGTEMAGQDGENNIADAAAEGNLAGPRGVWRLLAKRLRRNDEYVDLFIAAFDDIEVATDITFAHAANAISAFERYFWRADDSPFDRYLRGDQHAMSKNQKTGMRLFYGNGRRGKSCAGCHSGVLQTDHDYHAIAMPQIGPGRGDGDYGSEDYGREQVTEDPADRYKFRTPSLRNVALNAPYGHSGAYDTLRAVVKHHVDTLSGIRNYDTSQARLPPRDDLDQQDFVVMEDWALVETIASHSELQQPMRYSDNQIDRIIDFLHALTDRSTIDNRASAPDHVPSGLPLAD